MFFCPNCNNAFDITNKKNQKIDKKKNEKEDGRIDKKKNKNDSEEHKNTEIALTGGYQYETIIKKILDKQELIFDDIKELKIEELVKHPAYKKLKMKQKEYVYNKIQDILPKNEKKILIDQPIKTLSTEEMAYFICNNCGYIKQIEPKTQIFSRTSTMISQSYDINEYKDMLYSDILPRTRKYICPNEKCESHKDPTKKEAIFFRLNNSYKIKYICTACKTDF